MQSLKRRILRWDPDEDPFEGAMEFRLTYEGPLMGANPSKTRAGHKHDIRMALSPQLERLWQTQTELSEINAQKYWSLERAFAGEFQGENQNGSPPRPYLEMLGENYGMFGRTWLPLVVDELKLVCSIDVLYLRPGARGGVLQVGDIDGRLKTLFDALSLPRSGTGLPAAAATEPPVYTLLRDDSLISHVSVTTDELLQPTSPDAGQNDSRVVITVNIRPASINFFTLSFAGE